jgi:hypothetical protein
MIIASSNTISKDWMISKAKYNKKLLKQQKPFKDVVGKHKRVKSDVNAIANKMFPESLQYTQGGNTNTNSKKLLQTVTKTGTVYSYSNKQPTASFTTRINKKSTKVMSRGNYVSSHNTFKKPKGYKIMSKKSAESSPMATTHNQASQITESSGRPPTASKKIKVSSGHTKNSLSTHVNKKDNYFTPKDDEFQDDIDEFPSANPEMVVRQRHTQYNKETEEDDSSLFKYKEYKKMYFDDSNQKKKAIIEVNYASEQNKYKKLLNSHFKRGK